MGNPPYTPRRAVLLLPLAAAASAARTNLSVPDVTLLMGGPQDQLASASLRNSPATSGSKAPAMVEDTSEEDDPASPPRPAPPAAAAPAAAPASASSPPKRRLRMGRRAPRGILAKIMEDLNDLPREMVGIPDKDFDDFFIRRMLDITRADEAHHASVFAFPLMGRNHLTRAVKTQGYLKLNIEASCKPFSPSESALEVIVPAGLSAGSPMQAKFPTGERVSVLVPEGASPGSRLTVLLDDASILGDGAKILPGSESMDCVRRRYAMKYGSPNGANPERDRCTNLVHQVTQFQLLQVHTRRLPDEGCPPMGIRMRIEELSAVRWATISTLTRFRKYLNDLRSRNDFPPEKRAECSDIAFDVIMNLMSKQERAMIDKKATSYFLQGSAPDTSGSVLSQITSVFNLGFLGFSIGELPGKVNPTSGSSHEERAILPPEIEQELGQRRCLPLELRAAVSIEILEGSPPGQEMTYAIVDGPVTFIVPAITKDNRQIVVAYSVAAVTAWNARLILNRYAYQLGRHARKQLGTAMGPERLQDCFDIASKIMPESIAGDRPAQVTDPTLAQPPEKRQRQA